ncbi:MAG: SH3 domain-containing protein [Anaerolineae bacterium]|nr:SH3 domain-containing protein [Anaerolineae bacterium]
MRRIQTTSLFLLIAAVAFLVLPLGMSTGQAQTNPTFTPIPITPSAVVTPVRFGSAAPAVFDDILADLSRRTGRTITVESFDNTTSKWEWKDRVYADTGFECPAAGRTATAQSVVGYQFLLTLLNVDYDYRVSTADRTSLILCSSSNPRATPGPVGSSGTGSTGAVSQPGVCPQNLPGRLVIGKTGRVTPGLANRLRSAGNYAASIIGKIPAGGVFTVLAGPSCDAATRWWQVSYNGQTGFTAEGYGNEYWLEPIP